VPPKEDVNVKTIGVMFAAGLLVALAAAGLLVAGVIDSGPAAALGILGIGLIAASGRKGGSRI
jgi:hypothetical protein